MKIFILEDDANRMVFFKEIFSGENLTYTDLVDVAKDCLAKQKYDIIFLDHDLGGRSYVDSKEYDTGFRIALEIPHTINKDTPVVVHSWNPIGAKNMVSVLQAKKVPVQYIPFGNFNREILSYASK